MVTRLIKKLCLLFIILISCKQEREFNFFKYNFSKRNTILKTSLDTSKYHIVSLLDYPSTCELSLYDTLQSFKHEVIFGRTKPDIDWSPFTYLSYDTLKAKSIIKFKNENRPIYLIEVNEVNNKKFISACYERKYLGIIITSNYYSDTFNILIKTIFYNQYDYQKIDLKKHFEILKNTEIYQKE